jgi:hypothetical protein
MDRLITIAWPDRRRVTTKSNASAEIASAQMRSRFFCEHRSPPLPRFAVGCERMAAA